MRLHRFFVEEKIEKGREFATEDVELIHQWKDVFRLRAGEKVILLDNTGFEFYCTLTLVSKDRATATVDEVKENTAPKSVKPYEVHLYAALIKKDNFEWILEKGTELGVTKFVPVITTRTEKKDLNIERAKKIIKEASEQSGRGFLPELADVSTLESVLEDTETCFVAFHMDGKKFEKSDFTNQKKIALLVGPEGGWTDAELDLFKEKNIQVVSLSSQVLRAETAAIAVAALLLL